MQGFCKVHVHVLNHQKEMQFAPRVFFFSKKTKSVTKCSIKQPECISLHNNLKILAQCN